MLLGLAALAIPVLVHLLGRKRARRVVLPTAQFADGARQSVRGGRWLRRFVLMALRMAAVALAVLALAEPRFGAASARDAAQEVAPPVVAPPPAKAPVSERPRAPSVAPTIRVLVVDAARAEQEAPRSADFLAAAFAGEDPMVPKKVLRVSAADVSQAALKGIDAVLWVGPDAPPSPSAARGFVERGGGLVWFPADAGPPAAALADLLGADVAAAEDAADGVTLDPGGYLSDLLGAFESGSSGDLRQPVFKRRLALTLRPGAASIRFLDGRPAIVSRTQGAGRTVTLAFGPGRAWGDLATRPELVVLAHSLVEGVVPRPDRVKGAVAADRVRVAATAQDASAKPAPDKPASETIAWLAAALVLIVAAEGLVAGRLSMRAS
jgi:hypothetical protein